MGRWHIVLHTCWDTRPWHVVLPTCCDIRPWHVVFHNCCDIRPWHVVFHTCYDMRPWYVVFHTCCGTGPRRMVLYTYCGTAAWSVITHLLWHGASVFAVWCLMQTPFFSPLTTSKDYWRSHLSCILKGGFYLSFYFWTDAFYVTYLMAAWPHCSGLLSSMLYTNSVLLDAPPVFRLSHWSMPSRLGSKQFKT
jgi:hypothetical protein